MLLWKFNSPELKRYLISSIVNSVYKLAHELPNDLRISKYKKISKLGNKKNLQIGWVKRQTILQSTLWNFVFGNNGQNLRESRYQSFLVLSNFADFLNFCGIEHPKLCQFLSFSCDLIYDKLSKLRFFSSTIDRYIEVEDFQSANICLSYQSNIKKICINSGQLLEND